MWNFRKLAFVCNKQVLRRGRGLDVKMPRFHIGSDVDGTDVPGRSSGASHSSTEMRSIGYPVFQCFVERALSFKVVPSVQRWCNGTKT